MKISIYILTMLLTSFELSIYAQETPKKNASSVVSSDKKAIRDVLVKAYKWQEANTSDVDFEPISDKKEERYIGLNYKIHQKRMVSLEGTGYFSKEFLQNYDAIAKGIDARLKSNKDEWMVGDMPPFGEDANPWCRCQDYPNDNPWDKIILKKLDILGETATVWWTWGDTVFSKGFSYKVRLQKENGQWKISYLQGFDKNVFLKK
ncbi:hypothetical protein QM480_01420 [Flectobacillus sp. DC10W]|jgi:hypothetical protein|uniref:DUF3828 domain-containing protein n=1 Tax=Flectobacillus longus TaxID=2984207 RepID=A0ABT6YHB3_9BACT|nr:hypothetical protein [Flectobacillus longus]MDI9862967.1 hypothetical protein [Flectobacillus longus]